MARLDSPDLDTPTFRHAMIASGVMLMTFLILYIPWYFWQRHAASRTFEGDLEIYRLEKAIEAAREAARKQKKAAKNHEGSVEGSEPADLEPSIAGPSSAHDVQVAVEHSSGQSRDPGHHGLVNPQADVEHSGYRFPIMFEGSIRTLSAYSGSDEERSIHSEA